MFRDVENAAGMAGTLRMIPVADPATAPSIAGTAEETERKVSFDHREKVCHGLKSEDALNEAVPLMTSIGAVLSV